MLVSVPFGSLPATVRTFVRAAAAARLPGARPAPTAPLSDAEWQDARRALDDHRLWGLALAGELPMTPAQRAYVLREHRASMAVSMRVEEMLLALDLPGSVVLKGASFAHTAYPDASWRPFVDADLLVGDFEAAAAALSRLGFERRVLEPRAGFDVRFGKGSPFTRADGLEVDLHRNLALGPYAVWIRPDELRTSTFELAGMSLRCLVPEHRFLHACVHAVIGLPVPRLLTVRDVAQLDDGALDADAVARDAERWHLVPVLARAAAHVRDMLGVGPGPALHAFEGRAGTTVEERAVDAYTSNAWTEASPAAATMSVLGWRDRVAYARAVLLPSRAYLRARGSGSYLRHWALALPEIRRRVSSAGTS